MRRFIEVGEPEEEVNKKATHVAEGNKDDVVPIATSRLPQGETEIVRRSRCYIGILALLHGDDDFSDDDGGGVLPLALVKGTAVGRQEPAYEAVISAGSWGRTEPFNSRTFSRFLYEAGGRGTPMEPVFLNSTEIHVLCRGAPPVNNFSFVGHYTRFNHNLEIRMFRERQVIHESMFLVAISSAFNHYEPQSSGGPVRRSLNNPIVHFSFPVSEDEKNQVRNLEVGHAIASLAYAAAELGWEVRLLDASVDFEALKLLTGLTTETNLANDVPVAALIVFLSQYIPTGGAQTFPTSGIRFSIKINLELDIEWSGFPFPTLKAEQESENNRRYVASLQAKTDGADKDQMFRDMSPGLTVQGLSYPSEMTMWKAMRSRSSGTVVDFDGDYNVSAPHFQQFVLRCSRINIANVSAGPCFPHGVLPWFPRVNLLFFVNRVESFRPGLYCLVRSPIDYMSLKASIKSSAYQWKQIQFPPSYASSTVDVPFHQLEIDKSYEGAPIHQKHLVEASSFLVAMIAPKSRGLSKDLMQRYWEAGFLGELLIVEAQAQGISATILPTEPYSFWEQVLHRGDGQILSLYAIGKPKDPPIGYSYYCDPSSTHQQIDE